MTEEAPIALLHNDPFVARLEALAGLAQTIDETEDELAREILTKAMVVTLISITPRHEPKGENVVPIKGKGTTWPGPC